jgi:hypothetical protein
MVQTFTIKLVKTHRRIPRTLTKPIRKVAQSNRWLRHVCSSVCPHGTTRHSLENFELNFTLGCGLKICQENWSLVKTGHMKQAPYVITLLYVQVTVHRDKLRIKQPTTCIRYPKLYFVIKLYMFRASSVPIIRSYLLYTRQLVCFMQVMWPLPSRVRLELLKAWKH